MVTISILIFLNALQKALDLCVASLRLLSLRLLAFYFEFILPILSLKNIFIKARILIKFYIFIYLF